MFECQHNAVTITTTIAIAGAINITVTNKAHQIVMIRVRFEPIRRIYLDNGAMLRGESSRMWYRRDN